MNKRTTIAASAAALVSVLGLSLGVGGAAAFADDPPAEEVVSAEVEAPTPTEEEVVPATESEVPVEEPVQSAARVSQPEIIEPDTTPYVLVAWVVGDLGDIWAVPQTYKTHTDLETGDLNALDSQIVGMCGVDFQVDLYLDNATTASLIAGGVLYGPSNPPEALAYGAVKGDPWKFVDNAECPPPVVEQCSTYSQVHTTDLAAWSWSDTRATGHYALAASGLHIWTEGATSTDKVAAYYSTDFPLAHLGTETIAESIGYSAAFGLTPGLQLVLDADDDGTADGILVGESVYGNAWWLSNSAAAFVKAGAPNTGGGYGSSWYGTPDEWLAAFPDAHVLAIGFSLGSGVHGDGVLEHITLGCVTYTFGAPAAPQPEERSSSSESKDCEAGTVTTETVTERREPLAWDEATQSYPWGEWVSTTSSETRDATAEECPVTEEPPTEEPPATEPPAATPPSDGELAHTGVEEFDVWFLGAMALALVAAGFAVIAGLHYRRRDRQEH